MRARSSGPVSAPFRALGLTAALAVTVPLTAPVALAAPAAGPVTGTYAAPAATPEDFNGDGYRDIAVAAPGARIGGVPDAGHVAVLYGAKSAGLPAKRQIIHQDTAGVPGTPEAGDLFGTTVAAADLDRDGYTDLLVESADGSALGRRHGMISVIWGGRAGLKGSAVLIEGTADARVEGLLTGDFDGDRRTDVATRSGAGKGEQAGNWIRLLAGPFGRSGSPSRVNHFYSGLDTRITTWAAGDLNRDGHTDLAMARGRAAAPDRPLHTEVRLGGPRGLGTTIARIGVVGWAGAGTRSLAIGDINKDGYKDLVIGTTAPRNSGAGGGAVIALRGSSAGPLTHKPWVVHQNSAGVPGADSLHDGFGTALTMGDANGDGYQDVAVSVPYENVGAAEQAGTVVLLRGSRQGLTGSGAQLIGQNTAGVPGTAEPQDRFGRATRLVDLDRDGRAELVVGAPEENNGDGAAWILRGTASGITARGSVSFGGKTLGTDPFRSRLGAELTN
ncbi:hypothetical protein [Streptomyces sp. CAU 1734]|uniref:hypothetical protein n=1 Tax=Streptomyces sp. CAU 1734 TaxID=3140360 RepID=UPI003260448D